MSDTSPTAYQQLAAAAAITGHKVPLRPFEEVDKVILSEDKVAVLLTTYKVDERTREIRLTAKGTKLISFKREAHTWVCEGTMTVWDESYVPETIVKYGTVKTVREYTEQVRWERECAHPGTTSYPLESFWSIDSSSTRAMKKHWGVGI